MGRPKSSPWKPRSSSLGSFVLCDQRAAFERALSEGILDLTDLERAEIDEAKKSSPYADFGTCAHFHLQDGLRCVFPGPAEEFKPDPEQLENASALFGGDVAQRDAMIREVALLAARHMPPSPDNQPWFSEHSYSSADLSGHIDFVSQDSTVIVDLKTTARPPDGNRVKPEHLVQMCAYHHLVERKTGVSPTTGYVLYVSSKADWAMSIRIDYTFEPIAEYVKSVVQYAKFLRSKYLYEAAVPRFGKHCSDGWCPYKSICKEKVIPAAGQVLEGAPKVHMSVSSIFSKSGIT